MHRSLRDDTKLTVFRVILLEFYKKTFRFGNKMTYIYLLLKVIL
jgi:hypothetical protein